MPYPSTDRRPAPRRAPPSLPRRASRHLLPLLSLALVLAGCALIPPQVVDDPLGLDGMPVPLVPIGGPALDLQQARPCDAFAGEMTHCASDEFGGDMPNIDDSGLGGVIARFETGVGTRDTIEVAVLPGVEAPTHVALSAVVMDLHVEDLETSASVHPEPFRVEPAEPVTFERTSCTELACRYVAADASPLVVEVAFHGRELDDLLRVLTGGGDNRLSGTLAYAASAGGGAAAGSFGFQVTLDAPTGTIQF